MHPLQLKAVALVVATALTAQDPTGHNLLLCQSFGQYLSRCAVVETPVAPSYCFDEQGQSVCTEMTLSVAYEMPCQGHELAVGMKSGSASVPLEPGAGQREASVSGHGPFRITSLAPAVTHAAAVSPGCHLTVRSWSVDLSAASILIVEDQLRTMKEGNELLASAKSIESRAAAFRTLLFQIDVPAMKALLTGLRDNVVLFRASYGDAESTAALNTFIAKLDAAITAQPADPGVAAWRAGVNATLSAVTEATEGSTGAAAALVARLYVRGSKSLALATEATRLRYEGRFEAEHERAKTFVP